MSNKNRHTAILFLLTIVTALFIENTLNIGISSIGLPATGTIAITVLLVGVLLWYTRKRGW